jgi:hypothetical protein
VTLYINVNPRFKFTGASLLRNSNSLTFTNLIVE